MLFKSYLFTIFIVLLLIILVIKIFCIFIFKNQEYFPAKNIKEDVEPETVIVLHGIGKTNRITYLLAKRISEAGFEVYNISYPSKEFTIQELADFLNNRIKDFGINEKAKLNIVAHSMGGLITRAYINKYKPGNLNRVVMIGTPNHGSELADIFKDWFIYRLKFGNRASRQLGTDLYGLNNDLGVVDYDLGIIAGKTWGSFIFSKLLPGDDDGIVSVESTKLNGMNDHIVMNFRHTPGLLYKSVANMAIGYLKNGNFNNSYK